MKRLLLLKWTHSSFRLTAFLLALTAALICQARIFDADGISYNITSYEDKTCEVTGNNGSYSGEVIIPSTVNFDNTYYTVTSIGQGAFANCSDLTSIEIPNSVISIGAVAFSHCSGLTSIEIPNSVTSIGDFAFYGCNGLTSIEIPNSVTSIGEAAFGYTPWYDNLPDGVVYAGMVAYKYKGIMPENTSIIIKDGIISISNEAFRDCSGLYSIEIPNSVTSIGDDAFLFCSGLNSIEIPNSVISIGMGAFDYCSGLTSIEIPNSVTSIGYGAFDNTPWYDNLPDGVVYAGMVAYKYKGIMPGNTSIIIKDGIISIGNAAFALCDGLAAIEIPNSVTSIGNEAFVGCSGLTTIDIPSSVISIGSNAFSECRGLTSIEIPNSVTSIEDYAFVNCSGLTSIGIPNSVTSIGDAAFAGCSGLTSIEIPNSVTSIEDYAFDHCSGLTSIGIPNSVTSIGDAAFADCSGLTFIVCQAIEPPMCRTDCFRGVPYDNVTLKVPEESIDKYKAAEGWRKFFNIDGIPTAVNGIAADGSAEGRMTDLMGRTIDGPTRSFYILDGRKYLAE